jgi:hypothetical protein
MGIFIRFLRDWIFNWKVKFCYFSKCNSLDTVVLCWVYDALTMHRSHEVHVRNKDTKSFRLDESDSKRIWIAIKIEDKNQSKRKEEVEVYIQETKTRQNSITALCINKHRAKNRCKGMEVELHCWLSSRSGRFFRQAYNSMHIAQETRSTCGACPDAVPKGWISVHTDSMQPCRSPIPIPEELAQNKERKLFQEN